MREQGTGKEWGKKKREENQKEDVKVM